MSAAFYAYGFCRSDGTCGALSRRHRRIGTRIEMADRDFLDRHSAAANFFARPLRPGERELGMAMGTPVRPNAVQMIVLRRPDGAIDRRPVTAEELDWFSERTDWIAAYPVEAG